MTGSPDPERPHAAFAMHAHLPSRFFGPAGLQSLDALLDFAGHTVITDFTAEVRALDDIEVLITGWGAPYLGPDELDAMPRLRAIFHAAGTVKGHLSPEAWARGPRITTAAAANAVPVAEYALAMILLAGKDVLGSARAYAGDPRSYSAKDDPSTGNFGRTVGIIGASRIGRRVIELLKPFDLTVLLYDPFVHTDDPILASATLVDLAELFRRSTIVSVHAPLLPETRGLVGRRELALLSPGSTLINTARAPIVEQDAIEWAARERGVRAVLDVTVPEPLPEDHPLRKLDGVTLTPHVAGALGNELLRLGASTLREVELYCAGEPALHLVTKETLITMA